MSRNAGRSILEKRSLLCVRIAAALRGISYSVDFSLFRSVQREGWEGREGREAQMGDSLV